MRKWKSPDTVICFRHVMMQVGELGRNPEKTANRKCHPISGQAWTNLPWITTMGILSFLWVSSFMRRGKIMTGFILQRDSWGLRWPVLQGKEWNNGSAACSKTLLQGKFLLLSHHWWQYLFWSISFTFRTNTSEVELQLLSSNVPPPRRKWDLIHTLYFAAL